MAVNKISTTASPQDVRHVVNKNVQQRKRRRLLILLLLLLLLLLLIASIWFFAFYMFRKRAGKEVVVDVRLSAYQIKNNATQQKLIASSIITFREGDESEITRSRDIECNLAEDEHIRIDYDINNISSTVYHYTIDFTQLEIENFDIYYYENETGGRLIPLNEEGIVKISTKENITISVVIRLADTSLDYAHCSGKINFTISV